LEAHSTQGFLGVYIALAVTFYALLIVIYGFGEKLYLALKKDELNDDFSKYMIKFLSLMMAAFLFFFQIPMVSVNLQGYLCEEDPDDFYVLEDIKCGSLYN
jgi:hypothetical protein